MCAQSQEWGLLRFSTGDLPEAVQLTAVRELHERIPLPGSIEPLQRGGEAVPDCSVTGCRFAPCCTVPAGTDD